MLRDWSSSLPFEILGIVPTTEHYMLGDWLTSVPVRNFEDYTNHRALYARGLVNQPTNLKCSGTGRLVYLQTCIIRSGTSVDTVFGHVSMFGEV